MTSEVEVLRRKLSTALQECQTYKSRLQSLTDLTQKPSKGRTSLNSSNADSYPTNRGSVNSSPAGAGHDALAFRSALALHDDAMSPDEVISRIRLAEEESRVAELRRQVEVQRVEIANLKETSRKDSAVDLEAMITDLFQDSPRDLDKILPTTPAHSEAPSPRLIKERTNSVSSTASLWEANDDEGIHPNMEEIFDYISTRMLRGTLTESMFIRFLSYNHMANKTGVFRQLFKVLRLYQKMVSIPQDIGRHTETRGALAKIENITYDILDSELVHIYLYDKKRNIIECLGSDHGKGFNMKRGEGCVGKLVQNPGIINANFVDDNSQLYGILPCEFGSITVRSMLIAPILDESNDSILGVIQCFNKRNESFSGTDELILQQIAKQAALILTTTLKFQEDRRRQERNEAVMEIVKTVHRNEDIDEIISKVIAASYRVIRCDRVSLFMIDPSTNELWFKVSKDASASGFRVPVGTGIAGSVAESGQSLNIIDAYKDDRFSAAFDRQSNYQTRTILCIPVTDFRGKPVAVIQCINKFCTLCDRIPCTEHQVQFEDSDLEIMQTLAREVSSALQRKAQESSFQQAMDMDGNRSHMKDYISQFIGGNTKKHTLSVDSTIEWPLTSLKSSSNKLCDWEFDSFSHTSDELLGLCENMFDILELTETFKIPRTALRNFLVEIRKLYKDNPYHNFRHAFSVSHMCFLFVTTTSVKDMLTGNDILALITGAIGHDAGHPGMNNDFLINTEHELSIRYNDLSVLENHHAATLCQLLRNSETDIMANLTRQHRQELRKSIVEAILHTDMSFHKSMLESLTNKINSNSKINRDNSGDRQMLVNNILHCSDIGNPVLPVEMSMKWAKCIQQEFYQQALKEKELNIPYAAFMLNTTPEALASLQINFINYVVRPVWKAMHDFVPELTVAMDNMHANKVAWEAIKTQAASDKEAEVS